MGTDLFQIGFQRDAVDHLHCEVQTVLPIGIERVDRYDCGMVELRRNTRLGQEKTALAQIVRLFRMQGFDCDLTAQFFIQSTEQGTLSALGNAVFQFVFVFKIVQLQFAAGKFDVFLAGPVAQFFDPRIDVPAFFELRKKTGIRELLCFLSWGAVSAGKNDGPVNFHCPVVGGLCGRVVVHGGVSVRCVSGERQRCDRKAPAMRDR